MLKEGLGKYLRNVVRRWPAYRDIKDWTEGTPFSELGLGDNAITTFTKSIEPRIADADKTVTTICPYCAVGCAQLVHVKDGKIISIEGHPESPINAGTLCPKGAATYGFIVNPARQTTVKYRAPYADKWEERSLDWAMERIAQLVKKTRDEGYKERDPESGKILSQASNIASLGGSTLDNEENYLIKKFFGGGLGMSWIENQARV
jgi:formate dehydrogenase major subunit